MIQIPGYKLIRQLGKGGMATVYLAMQTSVDREVALKVMAPQLSLDPSFGDRFLREARISAKLHHRHVVSIFDVGVYQDTHYIAMEYITGGPVMGRDGQAVDLRTALRCVREIASALDYAHSKGFIHRDVKPDNILLRDDQSCVLSDFGIARASDSSTVMTKTGSVVGTPHYMSPEALRGLKIDGRSDLYSLGVVFYQLLTGEVPYQASDSLAIGIMHMTAPLPALPREYGFLQPLMQRMMAKKPEERVQSGAEVMRLVQQIETQLRETPLPTPAQQQHRAATGIAAQARGEAPLPELKAQRERTTMDLDPDAVTNSRTEPSLGRMEDVGHETWREPIRNTGGAVVERPRRPAPKVERSRRERPPRAWPWIALLLLMGAGAAGWVWRQPLLDWLKREFPIVFGVDPAPPRIGSGESESGQPDSGGSSSSAAPPASAIDTLRARVARAEREGLWFGSRDSALALYFELKRAVPDDAAANEGAAAALARARTELERMLKARQYTAAQQLLTEVANADAGNPLVAEFTQKLNAARAANETQGQQVEVLLTQAADALERRNFSTAAERYKAVLRVAPDNGTARSGLRMLATQVLEQAARAIEARRAEETSNLLNLARSIGAPAREISALRERAELLRRPAEVLLNPQDDLKLQALVEQGQQAIAAGNLVNPPASSAFDRLRAAQRINRGDPRVEQLQENLITTLKSGVDQALAEGDFASAVEWVDALKALDGSDRTVLGYISRVADGIAAAARTAAGSEAEKARNLLRLLKAVNNKHPAIVELERTLSG